MEPTTTEASIFARHALPNVPLEELMLLCIAVGIHHTTLAHIKQEDPVVCRMFRELREEINRRTSKLFES